MRFKPGDIVLANMGPKGWAGRKFRWAKCKVVSLWDEGNPYRLEIQNRSKTNTWAQFDDDDVVKKA